MDGCIIIDRAWFSDRRWLAEKPFRKADAWLDLISLANAAPTDLVIRGIHIPLERGDVGWSIKSLAERWGWGQGKVRATLELWAKDGQITFKPGNETTITHIVNYASYQDGLNPQKAAVRVPVSVPDNEQTESKAGADREQIETEKGEGRREKGTEGLQEEKGEGIGANHPDLDTVLEYFGKNGTDYTADEVRTVFKSFAATADRDGTWFIGRRPVGDWRAAMEARLGERRISGFQKNSAPRPDVATEGRFAVPKAPSAGRVSLDEARV